MSDVLSQSEIDQLLNAINSGTVEAVEEDTGPATKVRDYDFRTANRFSKEQIRTLNIIYDNFCGHFTTYLSGTLRAMCEVTVVSVEEQKYLEFTNSLPSPVILAIVSMPPLEGSTLLTVSPGIAYSMINRLLGGVDSTQDDTRNFTEIELVIVERLVRQFMRQLNESWEKVLKVNASLDRIETSQQFAQIVALNETIAIITLNVSVGGVEGLMNFCIPHLAIEPVSKLLNTKLLFSGGMDSNKRREPADKDIRARINNTSLPVSAVFNETTATVREVINLQIGDVIQLDHKVKDSLTVKVGHLPKFQATLGVKNNKYAVRIIDMIREDDESDE